MTSLARPIAKRAVHLRITPRPSNISDSREILRLVSQFGEVEYYKNGGILQYVLRQMARAA